MTLSDLSKLFNDTKHRAVSLRQLTFLSLILTKLGTHDLCANAQKNCGINFWRIFLNFKFRLSL